MLVHLRSAVVAALLLLACSQASAICPIFGYYRYVGDTASDSQCTDNDIQSAINNASATCPTNIVITKEHTYTSQALEIYNKSIRLEGVGDGIPCNYQPGTCDPNFGCGGGGGGGAPPAPAVTIHGNGSASVLYVHGTSYVTLQSIELTGGGGIDYGGGVHFTGTGALTLVDSSLVFNSATYGGAIQFNGSGGNATLTLGAGTIIEENTAGTDGGGIQINGSARLFALAPYVEVGFNHAPNGHGGGIAVVGPARADIGSPGYSGLAVVYGNDAAYGGGISADAVNDSQDATVRLFTTDAANPGAVSGNFASHTGGGIYLKPFLPCSSNLAYARLCASDFRIDDNAAQEGSAIYSDEDSSICSGDYLGGAVYLNTDLDSLCSTPETTQSLGGVSCAAGTECNSVSGNIAMDSLSQPTAGSAILGQTDTDLDVNRLVMRHNQGAHAIRTFGPDFYTGVSRIVNCLIADNTLTAEMIRIDNDGNGEGGTTLDGCTVANDSNAGAPVIYSAHAFTLVHSIIDEPGLATLDYTASPADLNVSYVLSNDTSTLPVATGIDQGEPEFIDAANGDYHLKATSIGIDFAPANGGVDLDGNPRDVDLAPVPNNYGPRDIGAYERQYVCAADDVFCNGFDAYQ